MLATPILLAAVAGGMAAVAVREAVLASPALGHWLAEAIEPLRRAGREGYAPTEAERRRLAALGTGALLVGALFVAGPGPAPLGAMAGPGAAAWAVARRRARYRRAVERGLPQVATAVADALAGGRSVRPALASAASSMEGPPAAELARRGDRAVATRRARGLRPDGGRKAPAGGPGDRRAAGRCVFPRRTGAGASRGGCRSRRRCLGSRAQTGALSARRRARPAAGRHRSRGRARRWPIGSRGARLRRQLDGGTSGC